MKEFTKDEVRGMLHGSKKFESLDELQEKIADYFQNVTDDNGKNPATITGLALALGTTRKTLCDWEEDKVFGNAIRIAKELVTMKYEHRCIRRGNSGDIFMAKNMGFTDKQEVEHTGNVSIFGLGHSELNKD